MILLSTSQQIKSAPHSGQSDKAETVECNNAHTKDCFQMCFYYMYFIYVFVCPLMEALVSEI